MHNTMEGFIGDLQGKFLTQPALDIEVTRKARGRRQAHFELLEHGRRQHLLAGRRSRCVVRQEGLEAAGTLAAEPSGPGLPV